MTFRLTLRTRRVGFAGSGGSADESVARDGEIVECDASARTVGTRKRAFGKHVPHSSSKTSVGAPQPMQRQPRGLSAPSFAVVNTVRIATESQDESESVGICMPRIASVVKGKVADWSTLASTTAFAVCINLRG